MTTLITVRSTLAEIRRRRGTPMTCPTTICKQCRSPITVDSDPLSESVPGHHEWRDVGAKYTAMCACTTVTREYTSQGRHGDERSPSEREADVLAYHAEAAQEQAEDRAAE